MLICYSIIPDQFCQPGGKHFTHAYVWCLALSNRSIITRRVVAQQLNFVGHNGKMKLEIAGF